MPDSPTEATEHGFTAAVLTVSDLGARGEREDTAGPAVVVLLEGAGFSVEERAIVPDDQQDIAARLIEWSDRGLSLVLTAGGTGLAPRDRTPQATESVIDYRVPGMEEAMRAAAAPHVPTAILSRGLVGVRGRTLIINLPGSERGATENLETVLPVLEHACAQLQGDAAEAQQLHGRLASD
jgi:molybdopterin adenylyltransferase